MAAIELASSGTVIVNGQNVAKLQARGGAVPAPQVRPRVPGPQAALRPQRVPERAAAAADRGLRRPATRRGARAPRWTRSGCWRKEKAMPITLRAASSSACASRARWCTGRRCCWPTSRPATWTRPTRARSSSCSRAFHQVGVTVVIATHDRLVAEQLPARAIQLGHGRVSRRVSELAARPRRELVLRDARAAELARRRRRWRRCSTSW